MIPSFPAGATIASIHTALVEIGRFATLDGSRSRAYGERARVVNKFGYLADVFARNALDSAITGSDLIEQHSAFPIYASLLPPESRGLWKAAQLAGESRPWFRYFATPVHGDVFADVPRLCPICLENDREQFGMTYWRVEHQLPSVVSCSSHGGLLHDRCADCGTAFAASGEGRLPGASCKSCGSTKSAAPAKAKESPGSRAHAALIARAAKAAAPELLPEVRIRLLRLAFSGRSAEDIIQRFFQYWKVKGHPGLERALACKISPLGLRKIFATGAGQVPFALVVAMVAFAVEELGSDTVTRVIAEIREKEASLSPFEIEERASQDILVALRAQARWLDLPLDAVDALLRNEVGRAVLLVGTLNLASMIDRLPEQHRVSLPLSEAMPS